MTLDVQELRGRFPALQRLVAGRRAAYLDGPGGSQAPSSVIEAIGGVLANGVSNLGGPFTASDHAGRIVEDARLAMADFLGAADPASIAFGQSMTALTLAVARSLARTWGPGDEVVVTRLDHDANISPWLLAAEASGATVRWVDFDPDDGCSLTDVRGAITERTRLVAVTHASNAVGTIPDVAAVCAAAREVGALSFVDAVHYAAHDRVDVTALDCDFLACSAYKFHGPHIGALYLGPRVVEVVEPERIRPAPDSAPGSWELGTASFEMLAGVTAAVDHFASLGDGATRPERLGAGIKVARAHSDALGASFLSGIEPMRHVRLFGIADDRPRTPTFAVEVAGHPPQQVAETLGAAGIFVWSGHYYALEVMRRLGRLESGGLIRIGFLSYNTFDEVERLLDELAKLG